MWQQLCPPRRLRFHWQLRLHRQLLPRGYVPPDGYVICNSFALSQQEETSLRPGRFAERYVSERLVFIFIFIFIAFIIKKKISWWWPIGIANLFKTTMAFLEVSWRMETKENEYFAVIFMIVKGNVGEWILCSYFHVTIPKLF